jgi:hypothetical protein
VKVLLVHNTYQQPGGEDVVFEQEARMLRNAGHQVILYQRSNWEVQAYHGLQKIRLAKRTIWASDTRRDFLSLLRDQKPDVVHVHNTFMMISPLHVLGVLRRESASGSDPAQLPIALSSGYVVSRWQGL